MHFQLSSRSQEGVDKHTGSPQLSSMTPGWSPGSICPSLVPMQVLASLPPNVSFLPIQTPRRGLLPCSSGCAPHCRLPATTLRMKSHVPAGA